MIANGPTPSKYADRDDDDDDDTNGEAQQRYYDVFTIDYHRPSKTPSRTIRNNDNQENIIVGEGEEEEVSIISLSSPSPNSNGDNKSSSASSSAAAAAAAAQPSSTATGNNNNNNNNFDQEHVDDEPQPPLSLLPNNQKHMSFRTLFTPQIEEYTSLTKFDPYSFSGAPLGGWGRATRSRLASLPVRLVSDYGGGMIVRRPTTEDFFVSGCDTFGEYVGDSDSNSDDDAGEVCVLSKQGLRKLDTIHEYFDVWGMTEELFDQVWSDVSKEVQVVSTTNGKSNDHNDNNNNNEEEEEGGDERIGLQGFLQIFQQLDTLYGEEDPWESTGPHFTFRDGMGRQFVCRVYDEGELEIENYMDSMFNPAVRLGYADVQEGEGRGGGGGRVGETKNDNENDDISIEFETTMILNGDGNENVAEVINSDIHKILEKIGITLDGQQLQQLDGEDIVVEAVVGNNDISDIVKAAIQGASLNKKEGIAATEKKTDSQPLPPKKTLSTQLTNDQIFDALKQLTGFCSQLHLGWWSYEWCHEYQVRQFHVDVSPDPTATDGHKYEIVDVTAIGHFQGKTEVIRPRGIYGGIVTKGVSNTYVLGDNAGDMKSISSISHGPKEDEEYSQPFYEGGKDMKSVMSNRLKKELQSYKTAQHRRLGHNGGIVRAQFEHGDMCDEVGIQRQVSVEYRCCTEDEISHWLKSKRKATDTKKDEVPLAVLVSVQEDETCVYRAKVCTPVLCPESLLTQEEGGTSSSTLSTPGKPSTPQHDTNDDNQIGTALGQQEAMEAVIRSLNEDGGVTEVKIFMGSEDTVGSLNELVNAAQNGEDFTKSEAFKKVMEAMDLGKQKSGDSELVVPPESIDGKSIREVLQSTLGSRPCLVKNLGW